MLMATLALLIDSNAFNGEMVVKENSNTDAAVCLFKSAYFVQFYLIASVSWYLIVNIFYVIIYRCRFRSGTLYWGYLLPMLLIMTGNSIVFVLVLKVIFRKNSAIPKRNYHFYFTQ